jgi:hypothetical protein
MSGTEDPNPKQRVRTVLAELGEPRTRGQRGVVSLGWQALPLGLHTRDVDQQEARPTIANQRDQLCGLVLEHVQRA